MSMTDPVADMLTRIRNGQSARKVSVLVPSSKLKLSLCEVLKQEGYIEDFTVGNEAQKSTIEVRLKYYQGSPVIESAERISKPGRRVYKPSKELPKVLGGFGIAIVSTSKGLMTDQQAKAVGYGGEILCYIS